MQQPYGSLGQRCCPHPDVQSGPASSCARLAEGRHGHIPAQPRSKSPKPGLKLLPKCSQASCNPRSAFLGGNPAACGHPLELIAVWNDRSNATELIALFNSLRQGFSPGPGELSGLSVALPQTSPPSDFSFSFFPAFVSVTEFTGRIRCAWKMS